MCYKALFRGIIIVDLPDLGLLALVEGVADCLPIDASAHALIVARLSGLKAGGLLPAFHLGVALAIALYFWRDMGLIASGLWKLRKLRIEAGTRLLAKMLVAALPLILVQSGLFGVTVPGIASVLWVGGLSLITAVVMIFADRLSLTVKRIEHIGFFTSLAVGVAQLAALVPGIGRVPGALILARLFGMERSAAFRFVMLQSLPVLLAEAISGLIRNGRSPGFSDLLSLGLSFLFVMIALPVGFGLMRRAGLLPFALYRLLFGLVLMVLWFL